MEKANILFLAEAPHNAERSIEGLLAKRFEISYARNLHEAFHHAKEKRPDVIVVEDNFQKQNGFELCEELRGESDTCYASILLLVSAVDRTIEERARIAGVNDVVQKNIDEQSLIQHIESLLKPM